MNSLIFKRIIHILFLLTILQITINSDVIASRTIDLPPAQIAVAPARATIDISSGRADGSIRLFNLGKEEVHVNTRVNSWEMDKSNNVAVIQSKADSLSNWIIINPVNFSIEPGGQQVVRYSIRPRGYPQNGEHRAMIFFDQRKTRAKNSSVGINFSVGVALYAHSGAIHNASRLHAVDVSYTDKSTVITTEIENIGNASIRFQGSVEIWPKSRYRNRMDAANNTNLPIATGALSSKPVLPGNRRVVETNINMDSTKGRYIALIRGKLGDVNIQKTKEFIIN